MTKAVFRREDSDALELFLVGFMFSLSALLFFSLS